MRSLSLSKVKDVHDTNNQFQSFSPSWPGGCGREEQNREEKITLHHGIQEVDDRKNICTHIIVNFWPDI
jgi:hypothetical protein